MVKQKKFTSISTLAKEMESSTRDLYAQTPSINPIGGVQENGHMPVKKRRARPESIIPRQNGKLLFLEDRHNQCIEQIHWTSKVDRQDVIRTAVEDFLERYYDGERLNEEGEQKIKVYYDKTHR